MDRLEEIKERVEANQFTEFHNWQVERIVTEDAEFLISEVERLRTVEQAYQALLSATAGQKK